MSYPPQQNLEIKVNNLTKIIEQLVNVYSPNLALNTTVSGNTKITSNIITEGVIGSQDHHVDASLVDIHWNNPTEMNQIEFTVWHFDNRTHYNITVEVSQDGINFTTLCHRQQFEATSKIHRFSFPRKSVKIMRLSGTNTMNPYLHLVKFGAFNKLSADEYLRTIQ